jgi:hypothetical protein
MKTKTKLLALALMAGGTMFAQTRLSIGVGVGVGGGYAPGYASDYYGAPAYAEQYMPPCPGPAYTWVDGYWAPQGGRRVWTRGYWRAPYRSGYRVVAPRYNNSFRDHDRYRNDRDNDRRDNDRRDNGNRYRR